MDNWDYDVVIVGAGPVGGRAATVLSQDGLKVLMLEEHEEVGRPFQCAGLVTPSAMDIVEGYHTVLEEVDGALIHGPSGTLVPVGTEGTLRTYVVCRKRFDQYVVQQGMEAGAEFDIQAACPSLRKDRIVASSAGRIRVGRLYRIACGLSPPTP